MNEKNIESLKTRLMKLGFESSVETLLRCNICFQPDAFELPHNKMIGKDCFVFSVHFEKKGKDLYEPSYYTATLRRDIIVPAELEAVNHSMQQVDWHSLVSGKQVTGNMDTVSVQTAFVVLEKLQSIGAAADLLRYKYWVGTALEPMILQLSVLKNQWEISERFYFFEETALISFDDAIRFLCSRWMEKQIAARKKLLVKKKDIGGAGGGAGGKLLVKKPRRSTFRGHDKLSS